MAIVAARMRATLVEVLGEARGAAMYDLPWLEDRVRFHLDPTRSTGAVFVAEDATETLGHTIVRLERDAEGVFGLFSTTYVAPPARRRGVAAALLDAGEAWLASHAVRGTATWTAHDNAPLIALFTRRGYVIAERADEMVRLFRPA